MTAKCFVCKKTKFKSEFYISTTSKHRVQSACKDCKRVHNGKYKVGKYFGYNLKSRYGITAEDYEDILDKFNRACAICKRDDVKLCLDHSHVTGKIRGILCSRCNSSLFLVEDYLNETVNYLNGTHKASK